MKKRKILNIIISSILMSTIFGSLVVNATQDELIKNIRQNNQKFDAKNYYLSDTDGDGIIDKFDKNPSSWDVTDRDLRFLMELSYRDESYIKRIFSGDEETIKAFNKKIGNVADIRELTKNWKFKKQINNSSDGFSVSFFENGGKIIVAFRGTNEAKDIITDARLAVGRKPNQVRNLQSIAYEIAPYDEYYFTGHSLGGYLAQYIVAKQEFGNPKFIHSAVFNAPGIKANLLAANNHRKVAENIKKMNKKTYVHDADKRERKEVGIAQPYGINGDIVAGLYYYQNTKWNDSVNGGSKHVSSNFFGKYANTNFKKWFSTGYRVDSPYQNIDTDKDGILDKDELRIGTDVNKVDSDNDGYWDKFELLAHTDPIDKNSKPKYKDIYMALPKGGLFLNSVTELTKEKASEKIGYMLSDNIRLDKNLRKQIPTISNKDVSVKLVKVGDLTKVKDYFEIELRMEYSDGSMSDIIKLPVYIKDKN